MNNNEQRPLTRHMDQLLKTVQAERDHLDQSIKHERELSQFVQQVLANMQDALIVADLNGIIIHANPAAYRELGFEPEALLGRTVDMLLCPDTLAAYQQNLSMQRTLSASIWMETIVHRGSYLEEHGLQDRYGKLAGFFQVGAQLLYNPQNKCEGVVITASNFTQRKRMEQALVDSEARLRHMLDGSPVPLFVIDLEHRVTHWNRACAVLTGVGAEQMVGARHPWQAFYEAPRPVLVDLVLDSATQEELDQHYPMGIHERNLAVRVLEGETYLPKLDKWLYFTAAPIHDSQGCIVAAMESIQDITKRKQNEATLQLAASVFEHAHEGILVTDEAGLIIEVNRTFEEITGYSREEVIGQDPKLLQSGRHDVSFYISMWQAITEYGYWHGEIWNRRKSGEIYPQNASISSVRNSEGEVNYYVGLFADISPLKESQQRLERMAYYDPLTGLSNRALLADHMQLALAKAEREQRVLAICYLDLDGFKSINDHWGHSIGDELLIQVAQRFKQTLRDDDTVARLGGDEFVILFGNLESITAGEQVLERLLTMLATPFVLSTVEITVSASIGATFFPNDGSDPDTLIRHADQAMYRAKQSGRCCYHLFDSEQDRQAQLHRALLERIYQGWKGGEFCLYYQPKVDMRRGQVVSVEALARWRHPEQGILSPAAFIKIVENSDFALVFGDWVLKTAIHQMAVWHDAGLILPTSVNLCARHLQQPNFVLRLQSLLAEYPSVRPEWLEIEVLETTALEQIQQVFQIISECRQLGIRFAIDDFGTGYSSLTYLKQLPAQTLKIDQSFIRDMLFDPGDLAIVRGIISLAAVFKLDVIAEGMESVEHGTLLLQLGCDHAQGYAIARPMPAEEIPNWIRNWCPPEVWNISVSGTG